MSITTIIAQQTPTGFRAIHCFQGGSPEQTGNLLLRFYRKKKKVELLILGGNIVSLGRYLKSPKGLKSDSITTFFERDWGVSYQDYFFTAFRQENPEIFSFGVELPST